MSNVNKNKNSKYQRLLAFLLLISTIILTPMESFAHHAYFIQSTINKGTYQYEGQVVHDKHRMRDGEVMEKNHMESELGNFEDIKSFNLGNTGLNSVNFTGSELEEASEEDGDIDTEASSGTSYSEFKKDNDGVKEMPFTFPSAARKSKFLFVKTKSNNHGTAADQSRAYLIRDTLFPGINEVISILNDGESFSSIKDMMIVSEQITGHSTTYNGWDISYEDTPTGRDIILKKGSDNLRFIYEVEKGYRSKNLKNGKKSPVYQSDFEYSRDVDTLSMTDLIIQANYAALEKSIFADSEDNPNKPSLLEREISGFLASGINQLRGLLGLYSLNDLVYNGGVRGPSTVFKGLMPVKWFEVSVAMHLIVQGIVWTILIFAVIKLLFMKNLSTVNPSMRVSVIEGFKDIFISMLFLATNLVVILALIDINNKVVNIFAKTIPAHSGIMDNVQNSYDSIGSVLMQIYYLFITIYFNAIYIYRSLYSSVLIASGPYYISKIAFGGKNKQQFDTWWKELIGNIFLQSYHAFILSIFLGIQKNTRGIELAVISFALIPLTKQFKSVLGGGGGLFADQTAGAGIGVAAGLGLGLSKSSKRNNAKNAEKRIKDSSELSSGSNSSSTQGVGPGIQGKSSEYYENINNATKGSNNSSSYGSSGTSNMDGGHESTQGYESSSSFVGPETSTSTKTEESNSGFNPEMSSAGYSENSNNGSSDRGKITISPKTAKVAKQSFSAAKGVAKASLGVTGLAFATMGTMALGSEPQVGRAVGQISRNNVNQIKKGASDIGDSGVFEKPANAMNNFRDSAKNKVNEFIVIDMDGNA